MVDLAMRDMEAAMDCISGCRLEASRWRQIGFVVWADYLDQNANGAEKWLVRVAKAYPDRCDHLGKRKRPTSLLT